MGRKTGAIIYIIFSFLFFYLILGGKQLWDLVGGDGLRYILSRFVDLVVYVIPAGLAGFFFRYFFTKVYRNKLVSFFLSLAVLFVLIFVLELVYTSDCKFFHFKVLKPFSLLFTLLIIGIDETTGLLKFPRTDKRTSSIESRGDS